MQIDIKLNIGTFILLGVISGLSYIVYSQKREIEEMKLMKGE